MALAKTPRQVEGTTEQGKAWATERLKDPKWVAKMKARSDEADAYLRSKGLLNNK